MSGLHDRPWQPGQLLVVLDIGKSNAKIVLVDPLTGAELASMRRPNAALQDGPVRQLDLDGVAGWLLSSLAALPERQRIAAIAPVAHGAACVMLAAGGAAVLAPDYEDPVLASEPETYDALRDPFAQSLSPALPLGLNLGRQIHHVQHRLPDLFERVASIVPYAQYWAFLLSGIMASEVTSLGCHTDLWWPAQHRFSDLATNAGWDRLFAPLRRAGETLGLLRPEIAARCGLPRDCAVLCGIHDSNASYLRHRMHRPGSDRFAVISSGTWTVLLASNIAGGALRQDRDMLANVDAFGALVGTARFMGGREYVAVAGVEAPPPDWAGLQRALAADAHVLPGFTVGGQFPDQVGELVHADGLDATARAALASFYVALLTDVALDLLGAGGDVIIDGPLAENPLFPGLLAGLRDGSAVLLGEDGAGSIGGARCLLLGAGAEPAGLRRPAPCDTRSLGDTRALVAARSRWREAVRAR
ncbi:hypothetical protein [Lichenicoccus sp.]|uniref:hypothetical protein n=1 Tax=Lichenicoccus sp. TaxID=2781899 RepID=UPI003D1101E3